MRLKRAFNSLFYSSCRAPSPPPRVRGSWELHFYPAISFKHRILSPLNTNQEKSIEMKQFLTTFTLPSRQSGRSSFSPPPTRCVQHWNIAQHSSDLGVMNGNWDLQPVKRKAGGRSWTFAGHACVSVRVCDYKPPNIFKLNKPRDPMVVLVMMWWSLQSYSPTRPAPAATSIGHAAQQFTHLSSNPRKKLSLTFKQINRPSWQNDFWPSLRSKVNSCTRVFRLISQCHRW